jgi:lipopolysaccharide biosynthesis regulator YciM
MSAFFSSLNVLASAGRLLARVVGVAPLTQVSHTEVAELIRRAGEARRAGRRDDATRWYREALEHRKYDVTALRGLRDLALETQAWRDALDYAERLVAQVPAAERPRESEWVAIVHYELGRVELERGRPASAVPHFRSALRADRSFVPAVLALGEAQEATGDRREALRTWERAVETQPTLPVLVRLERAYREEGRPSRMIALYRAAVERAPDDLALAVALGRVYFELEMLDEAADQFEKVEVRAPELPVVHAFLGAVFERRGETREAFEEYRRALRLSHAFDWPQRCTACGATAPAWRERCPQCGRWNALRPLGGH